MKIPLGTGTPPAASLRNAARGGAGRATDHPAKTHPLLDAAAAAVAPLLGAPCRTTGVQTETPSPGEAVLGLAALGGCQVGQCCPIPSVAARGLEGQRVVSTVTSQPRGCPNIGAGAGPTRVPVGQRTGTGWPGEGTGQVGQQQVGGGTPALGECHPAQQCCVTPPAHGTNQRQNATLGSWPSQPCCPQAQTQL